MNRAERRMLRIITRRGGSKRFTVLPSAETGLQNFGRLEREPENATICGASGCEQPGILLLANEAPMTSPEYAEVWVCRWHKRNPFPPVSSPGRP